MTLLQSLYQLLFGSLELVFEYIYGVAYEILGNAGSAIIPLSLCINFLLLPLYNRADQIQREERECEKALAPVVEHINKTFIGDERHMMLETYYRENNYKPIYALRSSLPLLLEIPFFVAAYHFLSNLADLYGTSFGPFSDLSKPDGLLSFGSISINLLPILMTLINLLSSSIYAKDLTRKERIQLYGMALIFLVLLYNSPSGLVLYWTLNNLFSLIKNIVNAVKDKTFVVCSITTTIGIMFIAYAFLIYQSLNLSMLLILLIGCAFFTPLISHILETVKNSVSKEPDDKSSNEMSIEKDRRKSQIFKLSCIYIAALTGLLIPSSIVASSPAEYVVITEYQSPLVYVLSAFLLAAGLFIIWFGVFYYLADRKIKTIMEVLLFIIVIVATMDYMLFGTDMGNLSAELRYDMGVVFSGEDVLINTVAIIAAGIVVLIIWLKKRAIVRAIIPVLIVAVVGMSFYNIYIISSDIPQIKRLVAQENAEKASFTLSKNGKNVIVFMLDRGIGSYVPYLLSEKPELVKQFDGFTWYPNTLSYGTRTNTGSPSLFGGYEYTPEEMNKRSSELLVDKQNEALKVMPVLFDEADYNVTVCDPPYAGYTWIPDLSIYDKYENIRSFNTENGQFSDQSKTLAIKQQIWKRNIFCYSIMKISPLFLQPGLYHYGTYYNPQTMDSAIQQMQFVSGRSEAYGIWNDFSKSYGALCALPEMTKTTEEKDNNFLMMNNSTAHNVIMLQEPQYKPELVVDNREYDAENEERFIVNGRTLITETGYQMIHYQCNMASFIKLGQWFDYLREHGVYDNTRIIIVADHGWPLEQFDDMVFGHADEGITLYNPADAMAYNPLLMVKEFNSKGFEVDYTFMTNADTPVLAMKDLVQDPENPFTGNKITSKAKDAEEQHVFYTDMWGTESNNGTQFLPGYWFSLKNQNVLDKKNWSYIGVK